MDQGILNRSFIWQKDDVEIVFSFKRFLSIVQKELAEIQVVAEVLKGEAEIVFEPYLAGDVKE